MLPLRTAEKEGIIMSVIHFSKQGFEQATGKDGVVLVDFWAGWCGPCKMLAPTIEELSIRFAGQAAIGKVDVDVETDIARQYGIMSIPTVVILKDGKEVERVVGLQPQAIYENLVKKHL